jgi:hypothetical protein
MPRIPTTDPQVNLSIGNQPNMPLSFGTAPGRAVQKLGSAISGLQGTFNAAAKAQEKDDLFKTKLALGEFAGDQDRFQAEYDNGVSEDGSNHANKRLETYDKAAGKLYERIPQSEAARKYAALQLQRMRNRYGSQSTDVEIRQRGRYTINQTTGFIKDQVLPKITGEVKSALTGLDLINGLVESSPIRDDVKEKIRDGAVKTVLEAWVAKAGPEAAARAETLAAAYGPGARKGATPGGYRAAQDNNPNRETQNVSRETQAKSASEFLRSRLAKGYEKRTGDVDNLNPVMQDRLGAFLQAAQEAGHDVRIISGHRSQERQAVLWRNALKKYGSAAEARKWVAPPGASSHNSGLAVDLQYGDRGSGLGGKKTAAVKWAHENARRYGLHFRLGHEDWHIEPVEVTRGGNAAGRVRLKETDFFKNGGMGRRRSSGPIRVSGNSIDPSSFVSRAAEIVADSELNGWVPKDGAQFGIRTGSPEEWARFFAALTKQESGFRTGRRDSNGRIIPFQTTPRGEKSYGPGQFNIGEYGLKTWDDVNDPEKVIRAYVNVAKRWGKTSGYIRTGTNKGMDAYFGSIRRPNEVRQHLAWAQSIKAEAAAGNADYANDNPPDLKERFARELIKQLPQIQRASERAEQQQQIEERRERRKIEAETRFEGTKLLFAGELTEQWLEENEGNLSISQRERFLKALNPIIRATNPQIAAELSDRAGSAEDPAAVIDDIEAAYVAGDLTRADANQLAAKAYGGESKANAPPWQKRLASDLRVRLKPPKDGSPEEWQDYYEAQQEFDEYVAKSGDRLDRKSLTEFTQDLVKQKLGERVKANREGLSMMRFSQVGRNALTLEEVNATEIRMLQALQARKISQAEANAEWKLIKSWRKTLEDEYKALGKEPPKPQGPIRPQAADKAQAATPATPEAARFGFAPGANLEVNPAVAAEVKAYSDTLPDEVKMQLLDESGNPKPETMQLVSSAMALGATPDKVPSILQTIYGMGGDDVPFYQQDGVNVSTIDFNQAYQKEADWQSSPWGAIDSWAERMIGQYDQAAASDGSDMTRRQLLEMLGVEILSDDDYADVQRRWKESQEWIKQNVPTSVARGLLQFGNSLLSVRGNDIADLDQAVPLDPVIMGLEGLRSATRWLSMNPNRIRPQDMLAAPGMAFMAAPFIRAARSAPGSAAQAMMRGVTDEDPTVAMPAMRNVTPDNDVPGRGIPQATPVENATGAISRDVPPPAAANDMAQSRPPIVADRPEMQPHADLVNSKYLAEKGASVEASKAYTSYRREAVRAGIEPLDQAGFSRMMADAGFEKAQIGGRPRYVGIVMAEQSKGQTAGTAIASMAERPKTFRQAVEVADSTPTTPGLDMSQPARLARAKEMGFDTSKTYYHGTRANFDEFEVGLNNSVFLADNPSIASRYTPDVADGGRVLPVMIRGRLMTADFKGDTSFNGRTNGRNEAIRIAQEQGYDGVLLRNFGDTFGPENQVAVFDPKNIRSVNAAFDPANAQSANLLLSEAGKPNTAANALKSADVRPRTVEDLIKEFKIKKVDESQSPAPPVPREIDDVGYTSQALEAARRLKQDKGTPEQILSQLKKAGVKDAEIEATGLREFMDGKKSVTRADVVQHLRDNRVDVRQSVLRGEGPPQERYVQTDLPGNYPVRREMGEAAPQPRPDRAKWQEYSVDEYNPTYRETVVHLPQRAKGDDFHQGHFPEPNVVGHLRSSVHDGPDGKQYVVNELQSDWGQKLRKDGGARDEAKIAELETRMKRLRVEEEEIIAAGRDKANRMVRETDWHKNKREQEIVGAELRTAEAATPGNPLVNTTDQWVTTMLRKSLMEAVDSDAEYITIASGKTVDGYDMGAPLDGLKYAYDEMYPKKLRDILKKIDPEAAKSMERIATVKASDGEDVGEGFVRFKLTDKVREEVRRGLPLFSKQDDVAANAIKSAEDRMPSYRRIFESVPKRSTPPKIEHAPAPAQRPSGMMRSSFDEWKAKPWIVNGNSALRFASKGEAESYLAESSKRTIKPIVDINKSRKQGLSPRDVVEKYIKEKGLKYTKNNANSTESRYITVNLPNGENLIMRFSGHSQDAATGGRARYNTKGKWDLPNTLAGKQGARVLSAIHSLDEWLQAAAKKKGRD